MIEHSRQKKLIITSAHGNIETLKRAFHRLVDFFNELKAIALQLTSAECLNRVLAKAMENIQVNIGNASQPILKVPT